MHKRFSRLGPLYLADDDFPRYRWVIIAQVVVQQQMGPFVFGVLGVLLPAMQAELGFGAVEAGWLGAARSAGNLLVLPASILLVRFSPVRTFNVFSLLLASALLLGVLAPSFWVLLLALVIYSVGVSWGQVPMNMIRQQWISPREMATVTGAILAIATVVQSVGLVMIPVVVAFFGTWRVVFLVNAVILLSIATAWFVTARERISPTYQQARFTDRGLASAKTVLCRREFYLLGLATLGGATTFGTFLLFLPTYYVEERGMALQTAGTITAVIPIGGLVVNLLSGYVSDRIGRRKPLVWPAGVVLPFLWFLMLMPLPPLALGAVGVVLGGFAWLPFPSLQTMPMEIEGLTPADRAVGQALQFTIQTSGALFAPLMVGAIVAATGSYRDGLLPLVLLPTLFIWTMLFLKETGRASRPGGRGAGLAPGSSSRRHDAA